MHQADFCRDIDIVSIIYIIYTHNFYTVGKPRISAFKLYAACVTICVAIPKMCQVHHGINIETGVDMSLKPFNRSHNLGFPKIYGLKIIKPIKNNDFVTYHNRISGNFTL